MRMAALMRSRWGARAHGYLTPGRIAGARGGRLGVHDMHTDGEDTVSRTIRPVRVCTASVSRFSVCIAPCCETVCSKRWTGSSVRTVWCFVKGFSREKIAPQVFSQAQKDVVDGERSR